MEQTKLNVWHSAGLTSDKPDFVGDDTYAKGIVEGHTAEVEALGGVVYVARSYGAVGVKPKLVALLPDGHHPKDFCPTLEWTQVSEGTSGITFPLQRAGDQPSVQIVDGPPSA